MWADREEQYEQDADALLQLNDKIINKIKEKYLRKPLILAIDWHDIMYLGDPEAYGVMGTQPRKGTHWRTNMEASALHLENATILR